MFMTNATTYEALQNAVELLNEKLSLVREAKKAMDIILNNYEAILENYKEYANGDIYGVEMLACEIDENKYIIGNLFNRKWSDIWNAFTDIDDIVQSRTLFNSDEDISVVDINGHELSK